MIKRPRNRLFVVSMVPLVMMCGMGDAAGNAGASTTSAVHHSSSVAPPAVSTTATAPSPASKSAPNQTASTAPATASTTTPVTVHTKGATWTLLDGYYMGATSRSNAKMVTNPGVLPANCPLPSKITYTYYQDTQQPSNYYWAYGNAVFALYPERGDSTAVSNITDSSGKSYIPMSESVLKNYYTPFDYLNSSTQLGPRHNLYTTLPSLWSFMLQYAVPNVTNPTVGQTVTVNLAKIMPPLNRYFWVSYSHIPSWMRKYWANPKANYEMMIKVNPQTGELTSVTYNIVGQFAFATNNFVPQSNS